jgi:hypothetical protein
VFVHGSIVLTVLIVVESCGYGPADSVPLFSVATKHTERDISMSSRKLELDGRGEEMEKLQAGTAAMHEALIPSGAFLGVDLILVSTEKPSRGGATSKAASDRWLHSLMAWPNLGLMCFSH